MQKRISLLLVFFLFSLSCYCQYKISGYLNTEEKEKTVYLSLLRYNEEVAIYPEQIITSVKTDSTGYFEFTGKLLPTENKLYRIHSNRKENAMGYEFIEEGSDKNYHNFIFSNADSIYFPSGKDIWFSSSQNTNKADSQWHNAIRHELKLTEEFSKTQNADAIIQAESDFLKTYKQFCIDSLSDALVQLLAYSHIKRNVSFIEKDFQTDQKFYKDILNDLNYYYSGKSYYNQFQEEISRLSISLYKEKIVVYQRACYILGFLILLLMIIILMQFKSIKRIKAKINISSETKLTSQERKVAELISSGKTNKEIADNLFISLSTVKTHIGNINSKLNVNNRQELIRKLKNHTGD